MVKVKPKLTVSEVALYAVLGSLTFGAKLVMMWLPNIEPVSLLVMLFAVTFGDKAIYPIYVYVFLEIIVYGFNLWSINYLYVWLVLAFLAWCFRSAAHPLGWAVLSGMFGLLFGALCAPVYLFVGGIYAAVAWWVSGIPYDVVHCVSNFIIALVLFLPLCRIMERLNCQTLHKRNNQ